MSNYQLELFDVRLHRQLFGVEQEREVLAIVPAVEAPSRQLKDNSLRR